MANQPQGNNQVSPLDALLARKKQAAKLKKSDPNLMSLDDLKRLKTIDGKKNTVIIHQDDNGNSAIFSTTSIPANKKVVGGI